MTAPALVTIARRALDELALRGATILVATSGGPDSMALLDVLARLAPSRDLRILAHGVDHGLRPAASAELDLAATFAAERGVPFDRTRVRVATGGNLQARARAARWAALVAAAREANAMIATAHHADDRAETVLLRLLRGAGIRGLGVLPLRGAALGAPDVPVVRPVVRARRADILAHVSRHRIRFASDPSNDDARYLRTRVRKHLMPLLAAMDPSIVAHLGQLADEAARGESRGEATWTANLPRATQEAIAALVRANNHEARVWLPGGLVVMLARDTQRRSAREGPETVTPLLVRRRRAT